MQNLGFLLKQNVHSANILCYFILRQEQAQQTGTCLPTPESFWIHRGISYFIIILEQGTRQKRRHLVFNTASQAISLSRGSQRQTVLKRCRLGSLVIIMAFKCYLEIAPSMTTLVSTFALTSRPHVDNILFSTAFDTIFPL